MDLLNFYLKLQTAKKQTKGFTLIELLVAIAMSGVVLTGLGSGMMAVLNSTNRSNAQTDLKNQLNRAIDYIHDDVKKARIASIGTEEETDDKLTLTYIASLQARTAPETIEYYIDDADPNEPWFGPKVLKRRINSGNWQVLVDGLTDGAIATGDFNCTGNATALSIGGFQACVEERTASNGSPLYRTRVALFGGTGGRTVSVETDSISRSVTPTLDPPFLLFEPATDLTPLLTWRPTLGTDSYKIYKCSTTDPLNECSPTTLLTTVSSADPLSYEDNTKIAGSRSCYRGKAFSGEQESEWGEITCTLIAPSAAPTPVADLVASDAVQPVVTWAYDPNTVEYFLYRCSTLDPSVACTIDPATSTLVDQFTVATNTEFADYVPWDESKVTAEIPNEGEAFCYGVVSKNDLGSSAISNIDCGSINAPLPINNSWIINFNNFDTNVEKPTGLTWNLIADASMYEIRRCQTTGASCDPATTGTTVLNATLADIGDPPVFNGISRPDPATRFCYAIRAKSETEASAWSSPASCGSQRPPECILNLEALGFGSSLTYKSTATDTERDALLGLITTAGFPAPAEPTNANTGMGQVLYGLQENSTGTYIDARTGSNQRSLPCATNFQLSWWYNINLLANPAVSIEAINDGTRKDYLPLISWGSIATATNYRIYRCRTALATCDANLEINALTTELTSATLSRLESINPPNGERWCYRVRAVDRTNSASPKFSDFSNLVCGAIR